MLEIIKAIIYGIVEGVTEWLPISSTGHLILVEQLIPFQGTSEGFFDMFDVVIQLGAILAVVVLFWGQIWPFALTKKERQGQTGIASYFKKDIWVLWFKILVSCVPAAVIGILFDDVFNALFYNPTCVALALIIFGVAFIVIENWNKSRMPKVTALSEITYQTALMIGVFQVIAAVFPGTSRSGATILGAMLLGLALPLRGHDRGRSAHRRVQDSGGRVYFFPGHSRDVWGKPSEGGKVRVRVYLCGAGSAGHWHGGVLCGIPVRASIPDGVY